MTYAEFELVFSFEYHPSHNEKLEMAFPLNENISMLHHVDNAYDEAFLSYRPWWSQHEQKSIVMLADSPLNDVVFYVDLDDYPMSYQTDWMAKQGMFALQPWNPRYKTAVNGTFYVRVRPDYNLADLIVDSKIKFNYLFRAFSQQAGDALTDIYADMNIAGVAFDGQSALYRHYITDSDHTIRVQLKRLSGKGYPRLMVKLADRRPNIWSGNPHSYDERVETTGQGYSATIDMHSKWRYKEANRQCQDNGYWKKGGSELCTLYIAVECGLGEEMCAYTLSLELFEYTSNSRQVGEPVAALPPLYIPRDQDYVDISVAYKQIVTLYFPIEPYVYEDVLIFVNKTVSSGPGANLTLMYDVQADTSIPYTQWYSVRDHGPDHFMTHSHSWDPV